MHLSTIFSFATIASGKPIHVPKISVHGNIHFWDPSKNFEVKEEIKFSVICAGKSKDLNNNVSYVKNDDHHKL